MKWGIISGMLFLLFLAWGQNFAVFNDFMYNYFPLYNKFRDTKMTLLVGQPIVVLAIGLGIKELINFDPKNYENTWGAKLLPMIKQSLSREGYVLLAGFIALDLCLLALLYSVMGTPSSPNDEALLKISPRLVAALQADRAAMIQADVFRAMGFILAALVAMYLFAKGKISSQVGMIAVALIACIDLGSENSKYLYDEMYIDTSYKDRAAAVVPTKADNEILADKGYYRVADYSEGAPSQSARASAFHKSMGGYSAAKPLLYQELWHGYGMDDRNKAFKQGMNIFNMLNVKYFIMSPQQKASNPTALGHVWFVTEVKEVENANEELESIATIAPQTTAVIQKKNAGPLKGMANTPTPTDRIYLKSYHPDTMTYVSETTHERFAVFSDMWYPPEKGWSVYINDKKADGFVKVNFLLRGMRIPKGKNVIKMVYEPTSQIVGTKVGGICSILIILLVAFFTYKFYTNVEKKETEVAVEEEVEEEV